ncbi:MAG TPA: glycosyltransferase family 39 protein [Thermoanaerobaculia bacterium]|nr:glycosyltransferase family 39 protein [Thermoanaerobaculia bacterium]
MTRKGTLATAVFVIAATVFITPFQRELYVGDETKYSQVVREMRDGAFFLPTLHGEPFTHKPPLHFWAIGLLTYVFGVHSLWPFVLPSLAAFLFLLWLMRRLDGWLAAFLTGTSLMVWGSAQTARMDVAFTAFLVLAAWLLKRFLDGGDGRLLLWSGVATGVATLIKGPMAPVIILALLLFERIRRGRLPRGSYWLAILLMAVIPLLWFMPAMMIGGDTYTRDVLVKQTAGRAVGAWVHKAAPWFYLTHAPADLFPWFFLLVVALIAVYKRRDEETKFYASWILAVLVPYSLLSSKLDVYMMAMIPPVAVVIARFVRGDADRWTKWGWRVNLFVLGVLLGAGLAGFFLLPRQVRGEERELAARLDVRMLFLVLALAALIGLVVSIRSRALVPSTLAVGFAPLAAFVYLAVVLVPLGNEMASTRPLVEAIIRQQVPPERVVLHVAPHLWVRGMAPELAHIRHVAGLPDDATVVVTRRRDTQRIADDLTPFQKVDEFRLIGKWFDVYRR